MRITHLIILVPAFISAWLLPSCAATGPTRNATAAEPARITVLYDAFGKDATMTKDWGYPPYGDQRQAYSVRYR